MNSNSQSVSVTDSSDQVQAHITLVGRVQGVGMRWHVRNLAISNNIVGFARNLFERDKVEVVAGGKQENVDRFIRLLWIGTRSSQVNDIIVTWSEFTDEYSKFEIKLL